LEAFLERPLTQRHGRRLQLTAEGCQYFEVVSPAFSLLQSATAQLRRNQLPRRVTVSALPLLANVWLLKRLGAFARLHPRTDIQLQYARYRNYSSDAADLSLRFGTGEWPGYESEKLLSGTAFPFASPAVVGRYGPFRNAADILRAPLIHDGKTEQWANWISQAGHTPPAPLRGLVCEDGMLTRSAMLADLGVALTRPPLIEDDLQAGRLIQLSDRGLEDGQDYYLCVRTAAGPPPPPVRQLAEWLRQA
jgi:DNA-binding transcriptional LysR family regulator